MLQRDSSFSTQPISSVRDRSGRPWAQLAQALFTLLLVAATGEAQVVRQTVAAQGDVVTLAEVQAEVALSSEGHLEVITVLGADQRSEAYQQVNLNRGDLIVALNGKLIRNVEDLKSAYETTEIGQILEVGVQRGDQRWIERFAKADPESLPRVRRMRIQGNPEDLALLMEIGVIFSLEDNELRISNLLPVGPAVEQFKEGDLFVALNGAKDLKPNELQKLWQSLPTGAEISFELLRNEAEVTVELQKPEAHSGQRRVVRQ